MKKTYNGKTGRIKIVRKQHERKAGQGGYTTSSARNVIKIIIRFRTLQSNSDQNSIYFVLTSDMETDGR